MHDCSYTYDAVGNRTQKRDEVTEDEADYTYNNLNQMAAAGNITYTWDDAGNMATKVVNQQTTTYTWHYRSKMLAVDFPEGDDVTLRYDGDGNRYLKRAGTTTTKFVFDTNMGLPALLFDLDGGDTVQAKYRRCWKGSLVAMKHADSLAIYHFDALGSTRLFTVGCAAETGERKGPGKVGFGSREKGARGCLREGGRSRWHGGSVRRS